MVTVQPFRLSSFHSSGIAVISLDLSSQAACAHVRPLSLDHAVTRCRIPNPCLFRAERRSAWPSMASNLPPLASCSACVHGSRQAANSCRSNSPNTRRNVSCDGMPRGSSGPVQTWPTTPAACSRTFRGRAHRRPRRPRPESRSTRCRTTEARTTPPRADRADPRNTDAPPTQTRSHRPPWRSPPSRRKHRKADSQPIAVSLNTQATITPEFQDRFPCVGPGLREGKPLS